MWTLLICSMIVLIFIYNDNFLSCNRLIRLRWWSTMPCIDFLVLAWSALHRGILLSYLLILFFLDRACHTFAFLHIEVAGSSLFLDDWELIDPSRICARPSILLNDRHDVHLGLALLKVYTVKHIRLACLMAHFLKLMIQILVSLFTHWRAKRTRKVQSIWGLLMLLIMILMFKCVCSQNCGCLFLLVLPLDLLIQRVLLGI